MLPKHRPVAGGGPDGGHSSGSAGRLVTLMLISSIGSSEISNTSFPSFARMG